LIKFMSLFQGKEQEQASTWEWKKIGSRASLSFPYCSLSTIDDSLHFLPPRFCH